jgi:hypothetical protein
VHKADLLIVERYPEAVSTRAFIRSTMWFCSLIGRVRPSKRARQRGNWFERIFGHFSKACRWLPNTPRIKRLVKRLRPIIQYKTTDS